MYPTHFDIGHISLTNGYSGVLTDKSYHDVFENIFRVAVTEKSTHLHGAKSGQKTALARLVTSADTLSSVTRVATTKLRKKTVKAICQHIIQTLPSSDGEYFEPIAQYYLKTLSTLFKYKPHVEQIREDLWELVLEFCLNGIDRYLEETDGEPAGLSRSFSGLGSGSLAANGNNSSRTGSVSRQNLDDLFQIVLHLVSAPSAPIHTMYGRIADSTLRFLQLPNSSMSQVHQLAFSVFNAVLLFTRSNYVPLSLFLSQQAVPIISRFWQERTLTKDEMTTSVRDQMMTFLIHAHPHLEKSIVDEDEPDFLTRMEGLADVLKADYARRSGRDQLHLDDIEMIDIGVGLVNHHPLNLDGFSLRTFDDRAERNWTHVLLIGVIERLLRMGKKTTHSDDSDVDGNGIKPRKRQKVSAVSDRLLDPLIDDDEDSRLAGLHVLPFVLHNCQLTTKELSTLLRQLHICVQDKRGNIAAWALLAVAR